MSRRTGSESAGGGHTIRGRIMRTVVPPLAAMLVLLGVVAAGEVSRYGVAAASESRAGLIISVQSLVQDLQDERALTVAVLGGDTALRPQIGPARERVDTRRAAMRSELAGGDKLERAATETVGKLDSLAGVRDNAAAATAGPQDTFEVYTGLIEQLSGIYRNLELVADESLRRGLESLEYLNGMIEATAQERILLNEVFTAGEFDSAEYAEFVAVLAERDHDRAEFDEFADPATAAAMTSLLGTEDATRARNLEATAQRASDDRRIPVSASSWWSAAGTVLHDMTALASRIGASTRSEAKTLRERAAVRLAVLSLIVVLCLAGTVYLAVTGARSLAKPLAALADEADRLAGDHLPEAVRRAVSGDDTGPPEPVRAVRGASAEVHRVADAFDKVQETAYRLATEQAQLRRTGAESLANLGRRNQNLLRRQLSFITRLEQEEPSPAGLANLFELDHLATRMRRNAESLLVLVGAASHRQWSGHLQLTDVIRAAVSEVEEYRRVVLRRMDDALVKGSVASDLAHMLAELIENGLTFSPPDLEVEIHGRRLGDGYLIAICDQGIGLTDEEMQRSNSRLRGDGDFLTAPARFLGHYVIGRLAAEMGAEVQLTPSPVVGVTARVRLPATILGDIEAVVAAPETEPAEPRRDPRHELRPDPDFGYPRPAVAPAPIPGAIPAPRSRPRSLDVDFVVVAEQAAERPAGQLGGDDERTPNGLRKRIPREHRPRPVPAPAARRPEPSEPVLDAPAAVGTRLTALREGIERGHATAGATRGRPAHLSEDSGIGGIS
ncbi:nitrate- and nitrite sensing domain-containing protein [Actinoplanes sp. NPDC026619]|uniref:sensor histidine kinase n=1 Tax=Actinoplanes sp. NPDC026619 TaxID=3155798 RepID=UPI0034015564